jgi:hypothetical protein
MVVVVVVVVVVVTGRIGVVPPDRERIARIVSFATQGTVIDGGGARRTHAFVSTR